MAKEGPKISLKGSDSRGDLAQAKPEARSGEAAPPGRLSLALSARVVKDDVRAAVAADLAPAVAAAQVPDASALINPIRVISDQLLALEHGDRRSIPLLSPLTASIRAYIAARSELFSSMTPEGAAAILAEDLPFPVDLGGRVGIFCGDLKIAGRNYQLRIGEDCKLKLMSESKGAVFKLRIDAKHLSAVFSEYLDELPTKSLDLLRLRWAFASPVTQLPTFITNLSRVMSQSDAARYIIPLEGHRREIEKLLSSSPQPTEFAKPLQASKQIIDALIVELQKLESSAS